LSPCWLSIRWLAAWVRRAASTIARCAPSAAKPVVAIGLGFDEQQIAAVPHIDYDERLDWMLLPSAIQVRS